jgi:hypothetical protein
MSISHFWMAREGMEQYALFKTKAGSKAYVRVLEILSSFKD